MPLNRLLHFLPLDREGISRKLAISLVLPLEPRQTDLISGAARIKNLQATFLASVDMARIRRDIPFCRDDKNNYDRYLDIE
eukprot:1380890-Amorphochlora_amoeboformis.AAC.1